VTLWVCDFKAILKYKKIQNLKFWQILKEINKKLLKTLKIVFVIYGGCPCKIGKSFDLGHFGI